jgi:hypothetical protein
MSYELELESTCGFDYVIFNSETTRYCGVSGSVTRTITSDSNGQWRLTFGTDVNVVYAAGFVVNYYV